MIKIIDAVMNLAPHADMLKKVGVDTVGRYLSAYHHWKVIGPAEAHALGAAGINVFLVYEDGAQAKGAAAGKAAGLWVRNYLPIIGVPPGACVYLAEDYNPGVHELPAIEAYFAEFRAALAPQYRIGCYGSGLICNALFDKKLVEKRWITNSRAFFDSKADVAAGKWDLHQHLPIKLGGLQVDWNEARSEIGSFVPFAAPAIQMPTA
jgi:glycoside hydrolase-like protein